MIYSAFLLFSIFGRIFGASCAGGQDLGPCSPGTVKCQNDSVCVYPASDPEGLCCPKHFVVTTTMAPTTAPCKDLPNPRTGVSDCPARASYCNDPVYYDQCPKTCNFCGSNTNPSSSTCADLTNHNTGISDCSQHKDLCQAPGYVDFMKIQCPKTCGYCQ